MSRVSITFVGRASELAFREFESGATLASFKLTVKGRNQQPDLIVLCEGYGTKIAEQFELMDEGCLVGIIGKLSICRNSNPYSVITIDRLEYLGKPLEVTA